MASRLIAPDAQSEGSDCKRDAVSVRGSCETGQFQRQVSLHLEAWSQGWSRRTRRAKGATAGGGRKRAIEHQGDDVVAVASTRD